VSTKLSLKLCEIRPFAGRRQVAASLNAALIFVDSKSFDSLRANLLRFLVDVEAVFDIHYAPTIGETHHLEHELAVQ